MKTHFQVGHGFLPKPSEDLAADADDLVSKCLKNLSFVRCPPKLFILWLTPAFIPYKNILNLLADRLAAQGFQNIPMIGCSVAACVSDDGVYEKGATLLCFASRFLEVYTKVVKDAQDHPLRAAQELSQVFFSGRKDNVADKNQFVFAFLPGFGPKKSMIEYRAGELLEELRHYCPKNLQMFGGVASAGINRESIGAQFYGREVLERAAVGALLCNYTTFGIGICHGLKSTEKLLHVDRVDESARKIIQFREGLAAEIASKLGGSLILSTETSDFGERVFSAQISGDEFCVSQPIYAGATLKVLRPDIKRMLRSVEALGQSMRQRLRLPKQSLSATIMVGCVSRYRHRKEKGLDVGKAFRRVYQQFPEAVHAGCYLDGEIGGDGQHSFALSNWSAAQLFISDEINVTHELRSGTNALAETSHAAFVADSLSKAMLLCLETIRRAGYTGAMISLLARQGKIEGIVAREALGHNWKEIILKRTARRSTGKDVLAVVARERKPKFIRNAQTDPICDNRIAKLGDVISFYTYPLINENDEVFGVLQIDLGEMDELPPEHETILDILGETTAAALNRGILADELKMMREFDILLPQCAMRQTVRDAISHFVKGCAHTLTADVHISLLDTDNNSVALVDGVGPYYEACLKYRPTISRNSFSPGILAMKYKKFNVTNDTAQDPVMRKLCRLSKRKEMTEALRAVQAYANFPILRGNGVSAGFVCIAAKEKYYFTPARIRSLQHVCGRLSLLLSHTEQKEATESCLRELDFLQEISPPLKEHTSLYKMLNGQIKRICTASGGEIASCFLHDEMQERFVLRAQCGWSSERQGRTWLDAAGYSEGEGIPARLAYLRKNLYVPDIRALKQANGKPVEKWFKEMFGEDLTNDITCEMIGLPLIFRGQYLGVLTIYHRRKLKETPFRSRFVTTDNHTLNKAAKVYSAFVAALQRSDLMRWRERQNEHQEAVVHHLSQMVDKPSISILQGFCEIAIKEYNFQHCSIYIPMFHGEWESRVRYDRNDLPGGDPVIVDLEKKALEVLRVNEPFTLRSPKATNEENPAKVRAANVPQGIILPVRIDFKPVGVLLFRWRGRRPGKETKLLPHHDEARLLQLADQLGMAMKNARRKQEAQWQEWQLRRTENWLVWQASADACDRLTGVLSSGMQEVMLRIDGLSRAVKEHFAYDPREELGGQIADSISCVRKAYSDVIEKAGKERQAFTIHHGKPEMVSLFTIVSGILSRLRSGLSFRNLKVIWENSVDGKVKTYRVELTTLIEEIIFSAIKESKLDGNITIGIVASEERQITELKIGDTAKPIDPNLCLDINNRKPLSPSALRAWELSLAQRLAHGIGARLIVENSSSGNLTVLSIPTNAYEDSRHR